MENIKEKFEFEVGSEYEGMRLDKYLSEQIEEATRSYLEKLIDNNFVKVNSKVINKNGRKLKLGEKIEVLIPEEENIDIEANFACTKLFFAISIKPLVSLSSLCIIPGLIFPFTEDKFFV